MSDIHHITRKIEIDAGHRVPDHKSKCFNLHGHRYVIEAECSGPLAETGEQTGMVVDFGFLKKVMMERIHEPCDHTFIFTYWDDICFNLSMASGKTLYYRSGQAMDKPISQVINENGFVAITMVTKNEEKLDYYIVPFSPTAENLARHWFNLLKPDVTRLSEGRAVLEAVRVWETPNCMAEYKRLKSI